MAKELRGVSVILNEMAAVRAASVVTNEVAAATLHARFHRAHAQAVVQVRRGGGGTQAALPGAARAGCLCRGPPVTSTGQYRSGLT